MAPRQAFLPLNPPISIVRAGLVVINHPGVDEALFIFPAHSGETDPSDPSATVSGVCRHLILDSCRVITNYAAHSQNDFLAKDREGKTPIPMDGAQPLTPGDYYYFLGPPDEPANSNYPTVKSFSAFRFPRKIPDHWYRARNTALLASA